MSGGDEASEPRPEGAQAVLRISVVDGALVGRLEGEIDQSNADDLLERLSSALEGSPATLVVDLSPVSFLSSAGLNALLRLARESDLRRVRLEIVAPAGGIVEKVCQIAGVEITYRTVEEALAGPEP